MSDKIPILIDTDANNELDDQHALAYAIFNAHVFDVVGVTVNNTPRGDGIQGQYDEAKRILQLCDAFDRIPLHKGAEENFEDIVGDLRLASYDGQDAVEFIVTEALKPRAQPLVVIPIGKLTNIALALRHTPTIRERIRIVWLGSNYPDEGEYNLAADTAAVNAVLESAAPFEMVTVRYFATTGSTAVVVDRAAVQRLMPGLGPQVPAVAGRHGGTFTSFGDYSISLFDHVEHPRRPLFDLVAVAIVKNPAWGQQRTIPPTLLDGLKWVPWRAVSRELSIWEHFDRDAIVADFFESMRYPRLPD